MAKLISILILGAVAIPAAVGLLILFRNELEIKDKVTGGYGIPVIFAFLLVFIVMPIVIFITTP